MARILRALALILVLVLTVSACSASNNSSDADSGYDESPGFPADDGEEGDFTSDTVRQVIYVASLTVSVADVNQTLGTLNQKAQDLGGYVSDSYRNNSGDLPSARITYRIPQAKYTAFLSYARDLGEPGEESVDSTDVTEEYVDLEARLANRQVHEERLLTLLMETASVEELLAVERELARVREDIEIIEGRLRYLDDRTSMARVEVYLDQLPGETEVPGLKPVGFGETLRRSLRALITSSTLFLDVISFIFIALAALLPFVIPIALLLWLIIWLRRKRKSRSQGA